MGTLPCAPPPLRLALDGAQRTKLALSLAVHKIDGGEKGGGAAKAGSSSPSPSCAQPVGQAGVKSLVSNPPPPPSPPPCATRERDGRGGQAAQAVRSFPEGWWIRSAPSPDPERGGGEGKGEGRGAPFSGVGVGWGASSGTGAADHKRSPTGVARSLQVSSSFALAESAVGGDRRRGWGAPSQPSPQPPLPWAAAGQALAFCAMHAPSLASSPFRIPPLSSGEGGRQAQPAAATPSPPAARLPLRRRPFPAPRGGGGKEGSQEEEEEG